VPSPFVEDTLNAALERVVNFARTEILLAIQVRGWPVETYKHQHWRGIQGIFRLKSASNGDLR